MASGSITSWQINRENVEVVTNFLFLGSKIIPDGDCSHEIRRQLLPARKWSEVKWGDSRSVMSSSLQTHRLYRPWNSPGQNTGVGSLSLLQVIFPTQGSNQGLPLCRQILYQLSHRGSPRILEWVTYPFSSRSSWPRNWTRVSYIAGGFFTNWAMREAPHSPSKELVNNSSIPS